MSLKLAARLVALIPSKIADLQENDTAAHTLDLSSILPKGTKALLIAVVRASGAGDFHVWPMSGSTYLMNIGSNQLFSSVVPIKDRELLWQNSVANDDWDLILFGYFVQKRIR